MGAFGYSSQWLIRSSTGSRGPRYLHQSATCPSRQRSATSSIGLRGERRPQYRQAVRALSEGHAHVLIVAKLDRLSRSLLDFAGLMAQSSR